MGKAMKLLITLILFITSGCQGSTIVESNKQSSLSLRQAFNKISEVTAGIFDQQPVDELFQKVQNLTCIETTLKLGKIGSKIVNKNLTKWILAIAGFQCMTSQQKTDFLTLLITNGFKVYEHEAGGHCTKVLLFKVDPTSKMLENFDEEVEDLELELCEELLISDALDSIVKEYIGDFEALKCRQMIRDYQRRFMVVFLNLAVEENQEVMESERAKCVEMIKENVAEVFECLMNKLT